MSNTWYNQIHEICKSLAEQYGLTVEIVAGIIVSLSAQTSWRDNLQQAKEYLETGKPKTGLFTKQQIISCNRIKAGENPLNVWGKYAFKYRNFYRSLLLEDGAVTVDSHMIAAYLKRHPKSRLHNVPKDKIFRSHRLYSIIQRWIISEAKKQDLPTYQMQAQLWVEHRGQMF